MYETEVQQQWRRRWPLFFRFFDEEIDGSTLGVRTFASVYVGLIDSMTYENTHTVHTAHGANWMYNGKVNGHCENVSIM